MGQTASFTLRHTGVGSWVWVLPTGQHLADTDTVSVTPRGPGAASIVVTARDGAGRELAGTHEFTVTAAP